MTDTPLLPVGDGAVYEVLQPGKTRGKMLLQTSDCFSFTKLCPCCMLVVAVSVVQGMNELPFGLQPARPRRPWRSNRLFDNKMQLRRPLASHTLSDSDCAISGKAKTWSYSSGIPRANGGAVLQMRQRLVHLSERVKTCQQPDSFR